MHPRALPSQRRLYMILAFGSIILLLQYCTYSVKSQVLTYSIYCITIVDTSSYYQIL